MSATKSKIALIGNIESFINHYGIENCGFLTLTFPDSVKDVFEASNRFNSFRTGFLVKRMNGYIGVYERTKRGVIHFHFVVSLKGNILWEKRGHSIVTFNYKEVKSKRTPRRLRYRSANAFLKSLWKELLEALPLYGFGRHELVPVKSEKGVAHYLAKYLSKGIEERKPQDKGFRLVRSTIGKNAAAWKVYTTNFAFLSNTEWREALSGYITRLAASAKFILKKYGNLLDLPIFEIYRNDLSLTASMNAQNYSEVMKFRWGPKWCYWFKEKIVEAYEYHQNESEQIFIWFEDFVEQAIFKLSFNPSTGEVTEL